MWHVSLTVTGAAGRNHHRAGLGGTRTSECPALSAFASYLSQLSLVLEVEHATGEEGDGLLRIRGYGDMVMSGIAGECLVTDCSETMMTVVGTNCC